MIYKDVFRIRKKKKDNSSPGRKEIEKDDLELVYENDKEELYVDKKRLSIQGDILRIDEHFVKKENLDEEVFIIFFLKKNEL